MLCGKGGLAIGDFRLADDMIVNKHFFKVRTMVPRVVAGLLLLSVVGLDHGSAADKPAGTNSRIVFHDDAQSLREAADADRPEQFIRHFIRHEIDDLPITTFCYFVATPDVCIYDTRVGEVRGHRTKSTTDPYRALWKLHGQGTDVLKIVIDELRPRGMEILAAIRMSDTHHHRNHPDEPRTPQIALDHPEYVIKQPDDRQNETALDYSFGEVRAHRLAIMRELAEDYDIDGLELNFCRWGKHFPTDKGREKAPIMTAFVGEIRETLDRAARLRGRGRLTLGVRVPERLRECWLAGLDPKTWVQNGWIDYLTVATFNETDPQVSVEEFAEFTQPVNCKLLVAMGNMMGGVWRGLPTVSGRGPGQFRQGYSGMLLTVPEARACAANYYACGADGVSFWNISCNMGTKGKFCAPRFQELTHAWMRAVIDRENILKFPRRYHYLPIYKWNRGFRPSDRNYAFALPGTSPLGTPKSQILQFRSSDVGRRKVYSFRMADGSAGEKLVGSLRLPIYHLRREDQLDVDINGQQVPTVHIRRVEIDAVRAGLPGTEFQISLEDCPPFRGENELGLTLRTGIDREKVPYLEEVDILVEQ